MRVGENGKAWELSTSGAKQSSLSLESSRAPVLLGWPCQNNRFLINLQRLLITQLGLDRV